VTAAPAPSARRMTIQQSGGNGSSATKREQHNEKAAAVGAEKPAEDAPEHGSIGREVASHHSPRRMGAGW